MIPVSQLLLILYSAHHLPLNTHVFALNQIVPDLFVHCSLPCDLVQQPFTTASNINISSQLPSNISSQSISSTSVSNFSYIIPYDQTQDCNIYGPLCQTGLITVGVNLTTTTTTATLPCSSYLSAQSAYIENLQQLELGCFHAGEWQTKFGESPECRSYGSALTKSQYTVSDCGSNTKVIQATLDFGTPWPMPAGVNQFLCEEYTFTCCGNCSLGIPEVRLYYFPDKTFVDCQNNQTSNLTSVPSALNQERAHSLIANGSTAVINGHTL